MAGSFTETLAAEKAQQDMVKNAEAKVMDFAGSLAKMTPEQSMVIGQELMKDPYINQKYGKDIASMVNKNVQNTLAGSAAIR